MSKMHPTLLTIWATLKLAKLMKSHKFCQKMRPIKQLGLMNKFPKSCSVSIKANPRHASQHLLEKRFKVYSIENHIRAPHLIQKLTKGPHCSELFFIGISRIDCKAHHNRRALISNSCINLAAFVILTILNSSAFAVIENREGVMVFCPRTGCISSEDEFSTAAAALDYINSKDAANFAGCVSRVSANQDGASCDKRVRSQLINYSSYNINGVNLVQRTTRTVRTVYTARNKYLSPPSEERYDTFDEPATNFPADVHAEFRCPVEEGWARSKVSEMPTPSGNGVLYEYVCSKDIPPPLNCQKAPGVGNPISPIYKFKFQDAIDYYAPIDLTNVRRMYSSAAGNLWRWEGMKPSILDFTGKIPQQPPHAPTPLLTHYSPIKVRIPGNFPLARRGFKGNIDMVAYYGDRILHFSAQSDGSYLTKDGIASLIYRPSAPITSRWLLKVESNDYFIFDEMGNVGYKISASGHSLNYVNAPFETFLTSPLSGRFLRFGKNSANQYDYVYMGTILLASYIYDDRNRLTEVIYPDSEKIKYKYSESSFIEAAPEGVDWLTGIVDEKDIRYATFTYNDKYVISTEYAGGVNKYSISEVSGSADKIKVVDPMNATRVMTWESLPDNERRLVSQTQPSGSGCDSSIRKAAYDSRGNIERQDDFNGKRVCHAYEENRNFETVRVEGLPASTSCSAALSSSNVSTLAPEARKITTAWHPDWKLETRRAEPGKITTWVYNGQPDPFNGGAIASCTSPMYGAASVDPLPDGKPIAVLCKQVIQSTTDVNGSQGFSATLQTQNPAVNWPQITSNTTSYTYNQYGQVLTSTDERGQVTTNTYYAATDTASSPAYTKGDLWKVTNALGHVTEYTQYNPHGQVMQVLDPNGVATSYTYDLRQRMTSVTQAGQLTQIDWWPTGLLKKVTQPDGSFLAYTYDDAHRLTDIADNLGNSVHYELDNAGNRKKEQVKDSSGVLTRQIDRNYDALNRLWKTSTGAPM